MNQSPEPYLDPSGVPLQTPEAGDPASAPPSIDVGIAPGTVVYRGRPRSDSVRILRIEYDESQIIENADASLAEAMRPPERGRSLWVHVVGVHDENLVKELGTAWGVPPLALEDIANTESRTKVDELEDALFYVINTIHPWAESTSDGENSSSLGELVAEQWSFFVTSKVVLSFAEDDRGLSSHVLKRLRRPKGRIRGGGSEYFGYVLVDLLVDSLFPTIEQIEREVDALETRLFDDRIRVELSEVHALKRRLLQVRNRVQPLQQLTAEAVRIDHTLATALTEAFYRDADDHAKFLADRAASLRDLISGLQESLLSQIGHRTNEAMRFLTVVSMIFIPPTFLAGIYGMNFEYIPELGVKGAYPTFWIIVGLLTIGQIVWFRKKNWL